jgi:transcriptional regulator with XRE-family HTH domain
MFHVGDVVWKLRTLRGWNIDDLAREAGVNKMTVSGIERGGNHTREKLDAVSRALGLADASGLDQRLHAWCSQVIGPSGVSDLSDGAREWLGLYDALALDADDLRVVLALVRRHANAVRMRVRPQNGPKTPADPGTPEPPGDPRTTRRRRRG